MSSLVKRPGLLAVLALLYTAALTGVMVLQRQVLTPDYVFVLFIPIALLTGRFLGWLKDWVPLVALMLGWEGMRGLAYKTGFKAFEGTWRIERAIFGGHVPSVVLQGWMRGLHVNWWLDPATTILYFAHFPATLVFAFVLWLFDRGVFLQYMVTLLAMSFAAFLFFLAFPTMPPWMAAQHGDFAGFTRIFHQTLSSRLDVLYVWIERADPNPVAAIPSMHAAYPFLGFLALRKVWPRAGYLALLWAASIWFSIVYLGEHYVVDAAVGIAWTVAFWLLVQKVVVPRVAVMRSLAGSGDLGAELAPPEWVRGSITATEVASSS